MNGPQPNLEVTAMQAVADEDMHGVSSTQPSPQGERGEEAAPAAMQGNGTRMILTLGLVAMLSGFLVVLVFQLTAPAIEANKREMIEKAIFEVLPGAVSRRTFSLSEGVLSEGEGAGTTLYAGYDQAGALVGIAAEGAAQGYADVIRLLYGYDPKCECIVGMNVIKLAETPGLGDKIITDADFTANFDALAASLNEQGSALAHPIKTVKHGTKDEPWEIDAISGATISSNAVGKAINTSAQQLLPSVVPQIDQLAEASNGHE